MVKARPGHRNGLLARPASWLSGEAHGSVADLVDWRYERTKNRGTLDASIRAYRRAVASAPPGSAEHLRCASNLSVNLDKRFQVAGDRADLDEAIRLARLAVDGTRLLSADRPWRMANLALFLRRRYRVAGDPADLEEAVHFARASARQTPGRKRADAASRWERYADYLHERYLDAGHTADLSRSIDAARTAAAASPPGDSRGSVRLADAADRLRERYIFAQRPGDLDEALAAARDVAARLPPEPGRRSYCLDVLARVQLAAFERSGSPADLEKAVHTGRRAVAALPPDSPGRADSLAGLAIVLSRQYEVSRRPADLRDARRAVDEAVAMTPDDDSDRHAYLAVRAIVGWLSYEQAADLAILDAAVADAAQAAAALPAAHASLPFMRHGAGMIALRRYERTGDRADLEKSVTTLRDAVQATGHGSYLRPAMLSGLGIAIGRRFELTGSAADLDDAIDVLSEAAAGSGSPTDRPLWMSNLAAFLLARFRRAGNDDDLDAAVEAGQQAADTAAADFGQRPLLLSNVSLLLLARHFRHRQAGDLDSAIEAARAATDLSVPGQVARPMFLMNLGLALSDRFSDSQRVADAEAAVRFCREALDALPPDHADRLFYQANLSAVLDDLADETGDRAAAAQALEHAQAAEAHVAADHPERARYLRVLGNALLTRYDLDGDEGDRVAAFRCYQEAVGVVTASPQQRLDIARSWGRIAARAGLFDEAAAGFSAAVAILPSVVWHGLDLRTRQRQAARWAGLAADAACCAVRSGRPERAVELLEQGRSMLWSQALDLRADLGALAEAAPALASRLEAARAILNEPLPGRSPAALALLSAGPGSGLPPSGKTARQEAADQRARAARDHDEALAEIRTLDGFAHYLQATPYPELAAPGPHGVVVIVTVSRYGSHAIIVTPGSGQARALELHGLDLDGAEDRAGQLARLTGRLAQRDQAFLSREADRHALLDILGWLWDVIADPILAALAGDPAGPPPRIWWCPTGPLVSLPLHAAGHHPRLRPEHDAARPEPATMLARTVSSYIPTLTALRRARGFPRPGLIRQLTVGTPAARPAGGPALASVTRELDCLARHFPAGPASDRMVNDDATRDRVRAAMAVHDWVHLACHAGPLPSPGEEVDSGFALWDGDLTVTDLAAQAGRPGGLAFLSACQTATGSDEHRDEALHLAAAMQFLGYSHVVATMWPIGGSAPAQVADRFYDELGSDADRAATALRQAVLALRDTDPTNPFAWAPYVHIGC
jgi:CHAT domain/Tetratricopeptide repeat